MQAGASQRTISAIRRDLQAALYLVCMYEAPTADTILRRIASAPHGYEFRRKFSDSPAVAERYRKTLGAFAAWLDKLG